jgi:hypothetical protein
LERSHGFFNFIFRSFAKILFFYVVVVNDDVVIVVVNVTNTKQEKNILEKMAVSFTYFIVH